jgi:hypothetical protein
LIINAQPFSIEGKVVDGQTKKRLAGAFVFINQSLNAVRTDSSGAYVLNDIPDQSFEVVVSVPGYEHLTYRATPSKPKTLVVFELKSLTDTAKNYDKDGWRKYGSAFMVNFLGTTINAAECELLNPEVLRFNYDDSTRELSVWAVDKLQIINDGLGYMINYQLESFKLNPSKGYLLNRGYANFKNLTTKREEIKNKWELRRHVAYRGSGMHFMRSLYSNNLANEGFEIHKLKKIFEGEAGYTTSKKIKDATVVRSGSINDKGVYKKYIDVVEKNVLSTDSIRHIEATTKRCILSLKDMLQVTFKKENEDVQFLLDTRVANPVAGRQVSLIYLLNNVAVQSNGLCVEDKYVLFSGYMGWEKLGEVLPVEYIDQD